MKTEKYLGFNCPIDIHAMPSCAGGFACSNCAKKVFDYSKMDIQKFDQAAELNSSESTCGVYRPYQLAGGFGDWRDKVAKLYRKTARQAKHNKRALRAIPILAAFLFLISCGRRHVCGLYHSQLEKPSKQAIDTTKTDLPTKQR